MTALFAATTAEASATFALSGTTTTLSLFGPTAPFGSASIARVVGAVDVPVGALTTDRPVMNLTGTGTFKVTKSVSTNATGVDRD